MQTVQWEKLLKQPWAAFFLASCAANTDPGHTLAYCPGELLTTLLDVTHSWTQLSGTLQAAERHPAGC